MRRLPLLLCITAILCTEILLSQTTISGHITDESGSALIGATVYVKNSSIGTITDTEGYYLLELTDSTETLIFSYIGYTTREVLVGSQSQLDLMLIVGSTGLDEVVVTGFGETTRRALTSSIASVGEEVFDGAIKTNGLQALQGRMAGVNITQPSGATSSIMGIRVRGETSINGSNQPLIVIDGVVSDPVPGPGLAGPGANPWTNLEPNDIESVEVLKDGASAAIYGARGANGVLIITTKSGNYNTKPRTTVSYELGFSQPSIRPQLMTGPEFANAWNMAAEAAGIPVGDDVYYDDPDNQPNTDWYDLLSRTGIYHDVHASVQGGSASTKYYIGASYRNQEDYFITYGMKRYSFQAKVEQLVSNKWKVGISLAPSRTEFQRFHEGFDVGSSPNFSSRWFLPNVEAFDENGDAILEFEHKTTTRKWSPYVELTDYSRLVATNQLLMNNHIEFSPISNLRLKSEFGVEYSDINSEYNLSSRTRRGRPSGYAQYDNASQFNYSWTNTATWDTQLGAAHDLKILVGSQIQKVNRQRRRTRGRGFADDGLKYIISAGETDGSTTATEYRFASFFSRINYAYAKKYFLTISARGDGSSRFGSNNLWGFFPAISGAWYISEESFFNASIVDYLKFSASAGLTGNAEVLALFGETDNFASRALLGFNTTYNGVSGSQIASLGNQDLTWEETAQYNVSVDFGLWQGKLTGTASWYLKNTNGLLLDIPVPATNGVTSITQNAGSIRNQGWEIELSTHLTPAPELSIDISINGAWNNNEITDLPDLDRDGKDDDILPYSAQIYRTGEALGTWYLVPYVGVDESNGDALFRDVEGNLVPVQAALSNRVISGLTNPKFIGGVVIDVRYRGFYLSSVFQSAMGHHIFRDQPRNEDGFRTEWNKDRLLLDSWTEDNTITNIPESRLFTTNGSMYESTRWIEKANYLRLKTLQIGYRFEDVTKQSGALNIYLTGTNLWLLTKAYGVDPEATFDPRFPFGAININSNPVPRTYSIGLKLEL